MPQQIEVLDHRGKNLTAKRAKDTKRNFSGAKFHAGDFILPSGFCPAFFEHGLHEFSEDGQAYVLSPGERKQVRASVKTNYVFEPYLLPTQGRWTENASVSARPHPGLLPREKVDRSPRPPVFRPLQNFPAILAKRCDWNRLAMPGFCCKTAGAMRILALDHGTRRIGVAVSDETKTIAQPLEYIPAEPFADFLARLKKLLGEKEVDLVLVGLPRNMDGSYGPAAQKVEAFVAVLKTAITVPIKMRDERLTSVMANRILIQGNVRRDKRKEKVDKMAAAILLQSYLDGI
jgi:putative holliday junction resolvase